MKSVYYLTKVYFIELVRAKWLLGGGILALLIGLLSLAMGELSMLENQRIIFHLCTAALQVIGAGIALVIGTMAIQREIETQTCLLILARPTSRLQFLLAKIFSVALVLLVFDLLMGAALVLTLPKSVSLFSYGLILLATYLEHFLLLLVSIFSGLFMGKAVAGGFALGVWLMGHWIPDLDYFAQKYSAPAFTFLQRIVRLVFPHFYRFNLRSIHYLSAPLGDFNLPWLAVHFVLWFAVLIVASTWIWKGRDLI